MGVVLAWFVSSAIALWFKKKIEDVAFISILLITGIIFISGLVYSLNPGVYIALFLSIICLLFCLFKLFTSINDVKEFVLTPGGIAFAFFIVFFAIFSQERGFVKSDEFTYWGYRLRGFFEYGDLWYGTHTHPATTTLWELFAEKTWIGFSESMAFWSLDILIISMMLPLYRFVSGENKLLKGISISIIVFLFPLSLWEWSWSSIMPDAVLGIGVGYCFAAAYEYLSTREKINLVQLYAGLYLIISTKRIGILWAGLILFSFVLLLFNDKKEYFLAAKLVIWTTISYILWLGIGAYAAIPLVSVIVALILELVYQRNYTILRSKFLWSVISLAIFIAVYYIAQKYIYNSGLNKVSTLNFCEGIFTKNITFYGELIRLSVFDLTCVFCAFLLYLSYIKKKQTLFCKVGYCVAFSLTIFILCLWVTYSTYIVEANEGFGQYVPGFERYVIGCFAAPIMLTAVWLFDEYGNKTRYLCITLTFAILLMTNISLASNYLIDKPESIEFYGFDNAGISLTESDKVYAIYEVPIDSYVDYTCALRYGMFPAECSSRNEFTLVNGDREKCITPGEFSQVLLEGQYDYVYIQTIDDNFEEVYRDMLHYDGMIQSGTVFEVVKENGKAALYKK